MWSNSTSAYINMYYVSTGNSAGLSGTSLSDRFTFTGNGRYVSEHKGASGTIGNQQVFQTSYKGTWSVTGPWELTLKRDDGKVSVYSAAYSAVRGGRILRLQDKKYSGMQYGLVRDK